MTKNIFIIILILALGTALYFMYSGDKDYKEQIEKLETKRDSLVMEMAQLEYKYDKLEKEKEKVKIIYKETETKLKSQQDETDAIPGIVATYSDRKLDSILTNYRFTPRAKSSDSNRP